MPKLTEELGYDAVGLINALDKALLLKVNNYQTLITMLKADKPQFRAAAETPVYCNRKEMWRDIDEVIKVRVLGKESDKIGKFDMALDYSRRALDAATGLPNEDKRLEAEVAGWLKDKLIEFQKRVNNLPPEVGELVEKDIEIEEAIIEVTNAKRKKYEQLKNLNSKASNPSKKQIILFAPNYEEGAGKIIIDEGFLIVKTKNELLETLKTLKKK